MADNIDPEAAALYEKHKEVISAWLKGTDPFKKAIGQTIMKAAGIEGAV